MRPPYACAAAKMKEAAAVAKGVADKAGLAIARSADTTMGPVAIACVEKSDPIKKGIDEGAIW